GCFFVLERVRKGSVAIEQVGKGLLQLHQTAYDAIALYDQVVLVSLLAAVADADGCQRRKVQRTAEMPRRATGSRTRPDDRLDLPGIEYAQGCLYHRILNAGRQGTGCRFQDLDANVLVTMPIQMVAERGQQGDRIHLSGQPAID